ncbi:MAG: hypothetical protein JWN90_71 [Parcubacteria group bacterium]|nr:hypothetical protein [Parcubacteria group bacterium]
MVRLKPALSNICEPLLGSSSRDANGKVSASYPILSDRHRIYREGIEVLIVFEDPTDAITLAMYRRQVTCWGDIPDDRLFLLVADTLQLTDYAWLDIAVRMPMGSCIRRASFMRAYGYRPEGVTAIAAE